REHLQQLVADLPRALPRPLRAEVLVLLPRRRGAQGAARDARPPARRARAERRGAPRPRGRPDRALPPRPGPRSVRRHLDARGAAYGVAGEASVRNPRPLFFPEPGKTYAVSAHLMARGVFDEMLTARDTRMVGREPPRLVLGRSVEPSEVVGGGLLIFDLRAA